MSERANEAGCPSCGGENLAACMGSVWCNECDWIDPPEASADEGEGKA